VLETFVHRLLLFAAITTAAQNVRFFAALGRRTQLYFGNMQFARRVAESTNDKNQRDLCPRDVFFTLRDDVFKQFVKPSDRPLSRPTFRSIGLDQRPIRLTFSLDFAVAWPDEHA
jgi:hypothetical protein